MDYTTKLGKQIIKNGQEWAYEYRTIKYKIKEKMYNLYLYKLLRKAYKKLKEVYHGCI